MSLSILRTPRGPTTVGLVLALTACGGGGGGGPTGGGNPPAVAGTYSATFAATQATPGCQGFVTAPSSTTGDLRVTQAGSAVTLNISELADQIASNAVGTLSESGAFHFQGQVLLDPDPDIEDDEVPAMGTIDGTFSGTSMNLGFNFSLGPCTVVGTIVGQR
ncbi:MAG TPA: hypothetical protein VIE68_10955 [Gemmatimonadota bacterium]|jgi:hypothetical protein